MKTPDPSDFDGIPMPDELRELIQLEKSALAEPGLARARLAARFASELGTLPAPHSPAPNSTPVNAAPVPPTASATAAPLLAATKGLPFIPVLAAFLAFGTGVGVGASAFKPAASTAAAPSVEIRYVERVVTVERVATATGVSATGVSATGVSATGVPVSAASSTYVQNAPIVHDTTAIPTPTASASASKTDTTLAQERKLIDQARSALARGDATSALSAVDQHAKTYPRGQLSEMREALAVQALARAGRTSEAQARGESFRRAFPGSVYGPVVDAAISSAIKNF